MTLTIDEPIWALCPELVLGVVEAAVRIQPHDDELQAELERTVGQLRQELAGVDLAQLPPIQALRRLYRGLGKDPARYRGSSEALLRRILQGKDLYYINTAVDVCNLVSIETRHCLGAYDLDRLQGEVVFRRGTAGEVYRGIGKGEINLDGLPVFSDALGPFGSPTSDSERTMITLDSQRIAFVIIACCDGGNLDQQLAWTASLLERFAGATDVQTFVV